MDNARGLPALELVTVDADGWPHIAWLSAGEVLVGPDDTLSLCLWPGSSTAANLHRTGQALLQAVIDGKVSKALLSVRSGGSMRVGDRALQAFTATLVRLSEDRVSYADVLSGPTYRLHDPDTVVPRWRDQLACLEQTAGNDIDRERETP